MSESILTSTKQKLGITSEYTYFDEDQLIDYINLAFSDLYQIGADMTDGFSITGESETWESYTTDTHLLNLIKSYVYTKVRLMFDPPTSSTLLDTLKQQKDEITWRISVAVDPETTFGG